VIGTDPNDLFLQYAGAILMAVGTVLAVAPIPLLVLRPAWQKDALRPTVLRLLQWGFGSIIFGGVLFLTGYTSWR